ncbi:MAG: hypothetical protein GXO36_05625, partial [Chloroflexi bacterium]|nr:hypothetical protein [Chloroflexota bacterium]
MKPRSVLLGLGFSVLLGLGLLVSVVPAWARPVPAPPFEAQPTPTPTRTPEPNANAALPAQLTGRVFCRQGPGPYYPALDVLYPGTRITLIGQHPVYYFYW